MNPSEAQVEEALRSVKNATQAAKGAQAAPSLQGNLEGPSVFALATADAQLLVADIQTVTAINGENAAYDEEWQSVAAYNQAMLAHPRPNGAPSLAGRYTGGEPLGDDDDDCKKEWKKAGDFCSQLDDLRTNDPIEFRKWKNVFGPNILSCMKGQVSERCGGHKI